MNRELLFSITKKDFDIHWFSGTGAGGQHRNKHQNCCRLYHRDSGARSTGQSNRSRQENLKEAFRSIRKSPKFKVWFSYTVHEVNSKETIEERIDKMIISDNLVIEGKDIKGRWSKDAYCEEG